MANRQYPCLCALIRKAGRIVTRNYDKYLKPSGLKITQLSMLANIARNPAITVSELAELLFMDQTTVSRNLRVLERSGLYSPRRRDNGPQDQKNSDDRFGCAKMKEAVPLWEKAQSDMEQVLGRESIEILMKTFKKLTK